MRIFFYLPVITPWWFDEIVVPMLHRLEADAAVEEVHIMVAPLWRNTGISGEHLVPLTGLEKLRWHIVDEEDPALFRKAAHCIAGLVETVNKAAPDLVLARSADFETPRQFDAPVRYIMEAAAAPFATHPAWIVLEEQPFAYGAMPQDEALLEACILRATPLWNHARRMAASRDQAREALGLDHDGPVLAVPLQYEHEENFFLSQARHGSSVDLLGDLLDHTAQNVLLAVTDHPLNTLHVSRLGLDHFAATRPDRIRLIQTHDATARLVLSADAVLTDLSKTWSLAAFYGTPLLHVGRFAVADWLQAHRNPASFHKGGLSAPDALATRHWFAWHLAGRLMDPRRVDSGLLHRHFTGALLSTDLDANIAALSEQAGEVA